MTTASKQRIPRTPRPAEIRQMSTKRVWADFCKEALNAGMTEEALLSGADKVYSTAQVAAFLGYSPQWVYWGLANNVFRYRDGTPIQPERTSGKRGRRRFTPPLIREIALSHHRRGNITEDELYDVMKRLLLAVYGPEAFSDTAKKKKRKR